MKGRGGQVSRLMRVEKKANLSDVKRDGPSLVRRMGLIFPFPKDEQVDKSKHKFKPEKRV